MKQLTYHPGTAWAWRWNTEDQLERGEEFAQRHYWSTNREGDGLFLHNIPANNVRQTTGTCQFSLPMPDPNDPAAVRRARRTILQRERRAQFREVEG